LIILAAQPNSIIMTLEEEFRAAKDKVFTLSTKPSNDVMLTLYSLYKQATDGDVNGPKPGLFDIVGQAKYNAWKDKSGLSKEQAMQKYIDQVESLFK
jgi:diazepam-binding inhibitor (GABA receptor modulator, acyl-CoA-binding protein)